MKSNDFYTLENICLLNFKASDSYYHLHTQENHPVFINNDDDYKSVMNNIAFASFLFPSIKIYTFEVLSNHMHFSVAGDMDEINKWFRTLKVKMSQTLASPGQTAVISSLQMSCHHICDLENLRNVIAYNNKNGSKVVPDSTPFSYPWGANRYYFNPEAKLRYDAMKKTLSVREKRTIVHSGRLDSANGIYIVDGYISPMCFCHIDEGESFFRNARQYFYKLSKNLEADRAIAASIGETLFYTDDDLFIAMTSLCAKKYGKTHNALTVTEKMDMAKTLHYDYNAGKKQICRLLKIDLSIISELF